MQAANKRRRLLLTTLSMDLARLGVGPWLYGRKPADYSSADPNLPPSGKSVPALAGS